MSRPKNSFNIKQDKFADYLATINNVNSRNKARSCLARLYGDNGNGNLSVTAIRLLCNDLADSTHSNNTIRTYLLECVKYLNWLGDKDLLNALYYYAFANDLIRFDSPFWIKCQPQNLTLPSD